MSLLFGFIMAPQHHTSTFACRAVGENKPQKMNDFRRESFLLIHASTSRLSGFRVAKATRNLPAIRWLYVIYQYIRWVKKSTSFQFCAANLQKLFQTTIIPPPHFHFFFSPLSLLRAPPTRGRIVSRQRSHPLHAPTATVNEHDTIRQAIGAAFFRRSRLFVLFHPTQPNPIPLNLTKSSSRYQK